MSRGASQREAACPPTSPHSSPRASDVRFPAFEGLLLFFALNLALQPLVEPDFGWHLRTGLDLLDHNLTLPATDPYSHTMPDWPWVEHAWLSDVLLAGLYRGFDRIGPLMVMLFFAGVTLGAFLIAGSVSKASIAARLIATVTVLHVALPFLGARTQLLSIAGLASVLWICERARAGREWLLWGLPALFLLWGNLHGGFTAGLFLLALWIAASVLVRLSLVRRPSLEPRITEPIMGAPHLRRLMLCAGLAAGATLVNPYGWRLHGEIFESLTDRFMLATLQEWQPVSFATLAGRNVLLYLSVLALAAAWGYRKVEPVRWIVALVFLGFALRHLRNIPLLLIVSLPLCADLVELLLARALAAAARIGLAAKLGWLSLSAGVALWMVVMGGDHLQRIVKCGLDPAGYFRETEAPIEAVEWLKSHRDHVGSKLYNDYGHGGFLEWWLPEDKIFIDGRMPGWRLGERKIFEDYIALNNGNPPALAVLDKYDVDWAIVSRQTPLSVALASHGLWRTVYEDRKVRIFVRS